MPRATINTVRQSAFESPLAIGQQHNVHIKPLTNCVLWALPWNLRPPRLCSNKILDASVSIAAPRPPLPTEEHMKTCQGFSPSLDFTRLLTWAVSTLVFLGVGHNKFRKLRHKTKPRSHQELRTRRSLPLPLPIQPQIEIKNPLAIICSLDS